MIMKIDARRVGRRRVVVAWWEHADLAEARIDDPWILRDAIAKIVPWPM